jgi:uncharacterized protein (DUF2147 family)
MKRIVVLLTTLTLMAWAAPVIAQDVDAVLGEWYTEDKTSAVEIYKCGPHYCGKIVWLKNPNNEDGTPKVDDENPDEALRDRPLLGLEILEGFRAEGGGKYKDGSIYDPEKGKTYHCKMTLDGDTLKIRGSIDKMGLLGRTTEWTRKK